MTKVGTTFSRRYVARRAQEVMIDTVAIHRPSAGAFSTATGMTTAGETVKIYQGKARIYSVTGPQVINIGEADLSMRQTNISIPADASPVPRRDDIVVIFEAVSDEDLQDRAFRVIDVEGGGLVRAVRRMLCTGIEESASWLG